ncbi:hypothetical protein VP01_4948g1 [Puccinia sorghi]|uniref:Transmembrane protein n=1 Tax=Puccinia sorghi TaxID=27349 RepID=A0A0L6ULX8_9BASI|nr:hypothetical protein VP01_4948g1 [Puccinia sorghi]
METYSTASVPNHLQLVLLNSPDPYPAAQYLPLATLLVPVLGSTMLHGSISHWQHLLLLGFALHHLIQLIRCPSGLLRASRPPPLSSLPNTAHSALIELRIINLSAILILLASPFLAVAFIGALQSVMRPGEPLVDRFATRLCFIAVAVRPCAYLINLFPIPTPSSSAQSDHLSTTAEELKVRSQALEKELLKLANVLATKSDLAQLHHRIKGHIQDLGRALDNLARHRKSAIPATTSAQKALSQTTARLAERTQNLTQLINQRLAITNRRRASPSAIILARTNQLFTTTGTTLQRLGTTLAPSIGQF